MLSNSIIGRLYLFWLNSAIFKALRAVVHPFTLAFPHSAFRRIVLGRGRVEGWYINSVTSRLISAVWGFFLRLFARVFELLKPAANTSFFVRCASGSYFLRYEVLLGLYFLVMFIAPHALWSNSYAVLAALGLFGIVFLMSAAGARRAVYPSELGLPLLLFVLACFLSLNYTSDRSDSIRILSFFVSALLFTYCIYTGIETAAQLNTVMRYICAAVVLTSLYAVAQRFMGVEVSASFTDLSLNVGVPGRVYSTLDNPNNYAEFLVLFTPLCVGLALTEKRPLTRLIICGALCLPLVALIMTYSRSGWLALLLSALVFVYFTDRRLLPLGLVAVILLLPLLPDSVITRFSTIFNSKDSSANHRLRTWQSILGLVRDHGVTGIGMGPATFAALYPQYALTGATKGVYHTQMLYLELIVETGVLGFVSFMWYMLREVKNAAFALRQTQNPTIRTCLVSSGAALTGMALAGVFEYVWFYPRVQFAFFILLGLMLAATKLAKNDPTSAPDKL